MVEVETCSSGKSIKLNLLVFGRIVFVSFVHFQKHKEMTPMKSDTNTLNTEEREREREREEKGEEV